jgi:hypothetical protein
MAPARRYTLATLGGSMHWMLSSVALCVIWTIAIWLCRLAIEVEKDALFIAWLVAWPVIGLFIGLAYRQLPALTWLGLGSIALAFAAFLLYWQVWNWDQCPHGEEGEDCQIEQLVVWLAGLYALGVAAAIVVGAVISTALQRTPGSVAAHQRS